VPCQASKNLVLVRFSTVEVKALPDLLERAWRLVAPKTVVKAFDAERVPTKGRAAFH
jgi:hypothetical protein